VTGKMERRNPSKNNISHKATPNSKKERMYGSSKVFLEIVIVCRILQQVYHLSFTIFK
jgi:hypothetical protein